MTKQISIILLLLTLTLTVAAQAPAEKRMSVLDVLKVGQQVGIKEVAGRYEIRFLEGVDDVQQYTVKAIESDHLVLDDTTEFTRLYIPIFSIKAIVRTKLNAN
jgi:hypothetical protein